MNKRELLKKVLAGEAPVSTLDSRPWIKVCRTFLNGKLLKEDIFATKDCFDNPTEINRITPARFKEIEQELLNGNLFALTFYAERRFNRSEDVTTWSAFGSHTPVAGIENVTELIEIEPTPLSITLYEESDWYIGL